jgi:hypothetical protein
MLIFELTYPGTWLDYEDQDWSSKTEPILVNLRYQCADANIALNLFLDANQKKPSSEAEKEWKRDETRRNKITRELQEELLKDPLDYKARIEVAFQAELKFKREKWNAGSIPREFEHQRVLMHARSFLYTLHDFNMTLKVLANTDGVPEAVQGASDQFGETFACLHGVEKTVHKPKLNYLNGTIYGNTMSDGHYGEVDVSPDSMTKVQSVFQEVIDSFRWKGPKFHYPSQ